jgi:hypothetical protein
MKRADALGLIAESFLKYGMESLSGGERHLHLVFGKRGVYPCYPPDAGH